MTGDRLIYEAGDVYADLGPGDVEAEAGKANGASRRQRSGQGLVEMTPLDWAILNELTHEPHTTARKIAEKLGMTANQVIARLRKLDRRDTFHVIAAFDSRSVGQSYFFVFATVRGRPLHDVMKDIDAIPETTMTSILIGHQYNLLVVCRFKNREDIARLIYKEYSAITGISDFSVSISLQIPIFHPVYLDFTSNSVSLDVEKLQEEIKEIYGDHLIDDIDARIIAELQIDGRSSINSIAKKHGINAGTVRYRIRSLESRELIHFVTLLNPRVVSMGTIAILTMGIELSHIDVVVEQLAGHRWLTQLFLCAGSPSAIAIVIGDDFSSLMDLKATEIDTLQGISNATLTPLGHISKNDVRWAQKPQQDI